MEKLEAKHISDIKLLYDAGMSIKEIAKLFELKERVVYYLVRE